MSKLKFYACLLVVWFLLISSLLQRESTETGKQDEHNLSGRPLKGRHVLASKGCINCHSVWGAGGKGGPDLSYIGMGKSLMQIAGMFWGHPPYATEPDEQRQPPVFNPEEMGDLISYLYYSNYVNEPGDSAAGRELFSEKGCIECHSIEGRGGGVGQSLDEFRDSASTLSVAQAMWNHGPSMAMRMAEVGIEKPYFKRKEMANLLAFIRSRAGDKITDEKFFLPGSPLFGQQLFAEKGCIRCHSIFGQGGRIGPDLSTREHPASVADIAAAMWNHDARMSLKAQEAGTPRPTFSRDELADIIAYLYFIRLTDLPGDANTGKKLFEDKGCAECHSPGRGSQIRLDLGESTITDSPIRLAAAIWNHVVVAERPMKERGLRWPKFEGGEPEDLAAYLKVLAQRSTERAKQ